MFANPVFINPGRFIYLFFARLGQPTFRSFGRNETVFGSFDRRTQPDTILIDSLGDESILKSNSFLGKSHFP